MANRNGKIVRNSRTGEPQVGTLMPDGTVYAGVSPDTGKPMYAAAWDVTLDNGVAVHDAQDGNIDLHGHTDWRVPTKGELDAIFDIREVGALKGTFNQAAGSDGSRYWSSLEAGDGSDDSWQQDFSTGKQSCSYAYDEGSVRFVRG